MHICSKYMLFCFCFFKIPKYILALMVPLELKSLELTFSWF